jgi:hypothetical protein
MEVIHLTGVREEKPSSSSVWNKAKAAGAVMKRIDFVYGRNGLRFLLAHKHKEEGRGKGEGGRVIEAFF